MIRQECFWYRPWKDMGATIEQCHLMEPAQCTCEKNCENFIESDCADVMVLMALRHQKILNLINEE